MTEVTSVRRWGYQEESVLPALFCLREKDGTNPAPSPRQLFPLRDTDGIGIMKKRYNHRPESM